MRRGDGRPRAFLAGVAMTAFGDHAPADALALQCRAAAACLADAGAERGEIDGLLLGYATTLPHLMPATLFAETFGVAPRFAHGVSAGGATGLVMVELALRLVQSGALRRVLVVAGENRASGASRGDVLKRLAEVGHPRHEVPNGASIPAFYALLAARHLHERGLGERDLAELPVLLRAQAAATEGAQFRTPITVEEVMASKPIAPPLKLLDCCPVSDGAAAVLVSADPPARGPALAIAGAGQAHTHQHMGEAPDDIALGARLSAAAALAEAGRGVGDLGRLGIYDSFSVTLSMLLEATGVCAPGRAPAEARDGRFGRDGPLPLNTHGGLMSYGHPGVAGGMAHLVETARRMREDDAVGAGRRPLALLHGDGGVLSANVSVVLEAAA